MQEPLMLKILGEPVPKGRPLAARRGRFTTIYTPKKTRKEESNIRAQIAQQLPKEFTPYKSALMLYCIFKKTKPKSARKKDIYPIHRPDIDNYLKLLLDAMNGVVFADDGQIVEIRCRKEFGDPGIEVTIFQLEH